MDKFPYIPVASRMSANHWRGKPSAPLHFVQIGSVSFYLAENGTVVRIMRGKAPDVEEYFLNSEYIQTMFPHHKIGYKVSQNEIKFHLLRMLGAEAHEVIDPVIDRALKGDENERT